MLIRVLNDPSRNEIVHYNRETFRYNYFPRNNNNDTESRSMDESILYMLSNKLDPKLPFVTDLGGFYIPDLDTIKSGQKTYQHLDDIGYINNKDHGSIFLTPFLMEKEWIGYLVMKSNRNDFLEEFDLGSIETFVNTLGFTMLNQYTQAALQERLKELTCLYSMSQIAEKPYVSNEDLMYSIMALLPPAWQYPEITHARIILDGIDYSLPGVQSYAAKLSTEIITGDQKRGTIEIMYTEERPELDEGPFLKEERKLLNVVANELAQIIIRLESEDEKVRLVNQLHHADRLATVGELAAGVAHEINEPLASILGFAQLAGKHPEIPGKVAKDLDKIVKASLHAREIIKKLMVFSRQVSIETQQVDLNQVIEESLYFFKSRCIKEGINLELKLKPGIPGIQADPVQLNQVLVNIVVNGMQAMPEGGVLTIQTMLSDNNIILSIKDTGIGMTEADLEQIFDPFFTTKGKGEGLGLGLSVVDGIIRSLNGNVHVISEPGKGTEFRIVLPAGS
jgi:signal transduction histidine kinase